MNSAERAHVVQLLQDSENEYLACIRDVDEAQWSWKPAPDRWSVGQTAEHILHAEATMFMKLRQAINAPANPDWEAKTAGKAQLLERAISDRSQKADAPGRTQPQGLPKDETVRRFKEQRAKMIGFAEETQVPLHEHTSDHPFPVFATLSAYQWLLLVPYHCRRHLQQIAEGKAAPGYPR